MIDVLTTYGKEKAFKSHENMMKLIFALRISPAKRIAIEQVKTEYPLGTTDGITYTVRPRG